MMLLEIRYDRECEEYVGALSFDEQDLDYFLEYCTVETPLWVNYLEVRKIFPTSGAVFIMTQATIDDLIENLLSNAARPGHKIIRFLGNVSCLLEEPEQSWRPPVLPRRH